MSSYDQWKTASPYDDERDVIEEADKLLANPPKPRDDSERYLLELVLGLREALRDEAGL